MGAFPIAINQDTVRQLQTMGTVHSIVAPNLFHHLHLPKFINYFPNIPVYGVDGVEKNKKMFHFNHYHPIYGILILKASELTVCPK